MVGTGPSLVSGDPVRCCAGLRFGLGFNVGAFAYTDGLESATRGIAGGPGLLVGTVRYPDVEPAGAVGRMGPCFGGAGNKLRPCDAPAVASCCCDDGRRILGYVTGDWPGEMGVCGDSATGDRLSCGSSSMMASSSYGGAAADSIDVAESDDRRRDLLADLRFETLAPASSLPSRIMAKYVSGGGRLLSGKGFCGPGVTVAGASYDE